MLSFRRSRSNSITRAINLSFSFGILFLVFLNNLLFFILYLTLTEPAQYWCTGNSKSPFTVCGPQKYKKFVFACLVTNLK